MTLTTQGFDVNSVELQPTSFDIYAQKYQLRAANGDLVDKSVEGTYSRVAKALAEVEPSNKAAWEEAFAWALANGATPAGRIMSNAGANEHKPAVSLINCTVSSQVRDSMEGLLEPVKKSGITLAAGCGIGYEFSSLRPNSAFIEGAGASTSGPLSFMNIFDSMCFTVSSAGGRRGAQMGTFSINHPDVVSFIKAKREDGALRQFNLSLLITNEFMEAVKADADWELVFPLKSNNKVQDKAQVWKKNWIDQEIIEEEGYTLEGDKVLCEVYEVIKAKYLWDLIMKSTYDFAEPGFLLIDNINDMNNNWWCENIRATNPCGEQPLPPNGACLLGSINLTKFVNNPFTDKAEFDWAKYKEVIRVFTRMLDNVVELNGLPLPEQQAEILRKRRHGMGYLGLGSALSLLGMEYGSADSVKFTDEVTKHLAVEGWKAGVELAKEKGAAPIFDEEFIVTEEMLLKRPELRECFMEVGAVESGASLFAHGSKYMQRIFEVEPTLKQDILRYGCRFTHHSSIAPTGTIALSVGNNVSNGIEPSFSHKYIRQVIRPGRAAKESVDVYSFEMLAYKAMTGSDEVPESFSTSDNVTPEAHVDIQAAAQYWVDSSISKTINVPTDTEFSDFEGIYTYAVEKGLKGCTTFRFNPDTLQGVLVREEDLENTSYKFTLESGEEIVVKGNEEIEYEGETHTAVNLYDAIKEGYFGKL